MILDIQYREVNGAKVLHKFAPNVGCSNFYSVDEDGYLTFDIKNFSWQKVDSLPLFLMLDEDSSLDVCDTSISDKISFIDTKEMNI